MSKNTSRLIVWILIVIFGYTIITTSADTLRNGYSNFITKFKSIFSTEEQTQEQSEQSEEHQATTGQDTLTMRLFYAEEEIARLQAEVTAIQTANEVAELQEEVATLQTANATINSNISNLVLTINGLTDTVDNRIPAGTVATLQARLGDLESANTNTATTIQTLQTRLNSLETADTNINSTITNLQSSLNDLSDTNTAIQGNISTLQADINSLQNADTNINSAITTIQGNISTLQTNTSNYNQQITTLTSNYSTLNAQVTTLSNNYSNQSQAITNLNNYYNALNNRCNTLLTNYNDLLTNYNNLSQQVTTLTSNYSSQNETITYLNNQIIALNQIIENLTATNEYNVTCNISTYALADFPNYSNTPVVTIFDVEFCENYNIDTNNLSNEVWSVIEEHNQDLIYYFPVHEYQTTDFTLTSENSEKTLYVLVRLYDTQMHDFNYLIDTININSSGMFTINLFEENGDIQLDLLFEAEQQAVTPVKYDVDCNISVEQNAYFERAFILFDDSFVNTHGINIQDVIAFGYPSNYQDENEYINKNANFDYEYNRIMQHQEDLLTNFVVNGTSYTEFNTTGTVYAIMTVHTVGTDKTVGYFIGSVNVTGNGTINISYTEQNSIISFNPTLNNDPVSI